MDRSLLQCCENKSSVRLQAAEVMGCRRNKKTICEYQKKTRKQSFNQFDCWKFHHPLFIHFIFFSVQNPRKPGTLKFSSTNSRFKGSSRVAIDAKRRSRRKVSDAKRKAEGQASTATRAKVSLDLRSETGHRIAGSCRFGPASKPQKTLDSPISRSLGTICGRLVSEKCGKMFFGDSSATLVFFYLGLGALLIRVSCLFR